MCPGCNKSFKVVEVVKDGGSEEKEEELGIEIPFLFLKKEPSEERGWSILPSFTVLPCVIILFGQF